MTPRTKVQSNPNLRPSIPKSMQPKTTEEHLASVEDAAAFLQAAQAEVDRCRAELDRRVVLARTKKVSLRRIAGASGLSHQTIARIGLQ